MFQFGWRVVWRFGIKVCVGRWLVSDQIYKFGQRGWKTKLRVVFSLAGFVNGMNVVSMGDQEFICLVNLLIEI